MEYSPFPMALFARENGKQLYGDRGTRGTLFSEKHRETPYLEWLVGGFNHLEKYEFVNGKDDIPYMKWKMKNVWNHQPDDIHSFVHLSNLYTKLNLIRSDQICSYWNQIPRRDSFSDHDGFKPHEIFEIAEENTA